MSTASDLGSSVANTGQKRKVSAYSLAQRTRCWRADFKFFDENPQRRHLVRAAAHCESNHKGSAFPQALAIASMQWMESPTFRQLIVPAEAVDVEACRDDLGEAASRIIFEMALKRPDLIEHDDLIWLIDGEPLPTDRMLQREHEPSFDPDDTSWRTQ